MKKFRRPEPPALVRAIATFLVIASAAIVFAWLASYGTWHLLEEEDFGGIFDAQARSLLAGRVDVLESEISSEAFVRNGKFYTYFGPAPALLRVVPTWLFPSMYGRWSRLFMLAASILSLAAASSLYRIAERRLTGGEDGRKPDLLGPAMFLLAAGLGSSLIFLASRSFAYHEALIWSGAFSLSAYWGLVRFLERPSTRLLLATCVLACLAFFSRVAGGAGAVFACGLLLLGLLISWAESRWRGRLPSVVSRIPEWLGLETNSKAGVHALVLLSFLLCLTASHLGLNYWKWGEAFVSVPLKYHRQTFSDPERLERLKADAFSVRQVRVTFVNYFLRRNLEVSSTYPFFRMNSGKAGRKSFEGEFPEAKVDSVEPFSSLPASSPGLFVLGLVGVAAMFLLRRPELRLFRIPLLAAAAGASVVLTIGFLTYRYLHDFYPVLVIAAAVGGAFVGTRRSRIRRSIVRGAVFLLLTFGILVNVILAVDYQRRVVWGVDHRIRRRYEIAVDRLNRFLDPRLPSTVFRMIVQFPRRPASSVEPMMTLGRESAGDLFFVKYLSPDSVAFGYHHQGLGGSLSAPISIVPGRDYRADIAIEPERESVRFTFDGQTIYTQLTSLHPWDASRVFVGHNPIGGTVCSESFSGTIRLSP